MDANTVTPTSDHAADSHPLDLFHNRVRQIYKINSERIPPVIRSAISQRRLLSWEAYATPMFGMEMPGTARRGLGALWGAAATIAPVHVANRTSQTEVSVVPHRRPTSPTLDSELQATNADEFGALLRLIRQRSGLSVGKLAEAAGLPRSQAYALLNKDRHVLPVKGEQVESFARACGLSSPHVERVLRLWAELRENRDREQGAALVEANAQLTQEIGETIRPRPEQGAVLQGVDLAFGWSALLAWTGSIAAAKAILGLFRENWRLTTSDVLSIILGLFAFRVLTTGRDRTGRSSSSTGISLVEDSPVR